MQLLDWIVMVAYAVGMLGVGWYFSKKSQTSEDYMLGGRRMASWAIGLSLFASLFSALSYISVPGEIIKYGLGTYYGLVSFPLIYITVSWFLIPTFMKVKVGSAYELLEVRLGSGPRLLASIIFLAIRLLWMAVIIYMCSTKIIVPVMGWEGKILTVPGLGWKIEDPAFWISVAMGIVTVIYTSMGGLRAVVLTDVVQTFILFMAAALAIILILADRGFGGYIPEKMPDTWVEFKWWDATIRYSFFTSFVTMLFWHVCTAGSDQMAVQRYIATADLKSARKGYLTSLISELLVAVFIIVLGIGLISYYQAHPASIQGGDAIGNSADKLFPAFIVDVLPMGLTGLALAGLMAAAMSSLSSGLNSSCLVISRDFILRYSKREIPDKTQVLLAKLISLGIGAAIVGLSFLASMIKGNLYEVVFQTCNLLTACLFVPFFMAFFVRKATSWATTFGTLLSIVDAVLVGYSEEFFGVNIPFVWIMPSSLVVGVAASWILSLIWPAKSPAIPPAQ